MPILKMINILMCPGLNIIATIQLNLLFSPLSTFFLINSFSCLSVPLVLYISTCLPTLRGNGSSRYIPLCLLSCVYLQTQQCHIEQCSTGENTSQEEERSTMALQWRPHIRTTQRRGDQDTRIPIVKRLPMTAPKRTMRTIQRLLQSQRRRTKSILACISKRPDGSITMDGLILNPLQRRRASIRSIGLDFSLNSMKGWSNLLGRDTKR